MANNKYSIFDEFYCLYEDGLYSRVEFISKVIDLLGAGDDLLWEYLPEEIKAIISDKLKSFSNEDEVVSFSCVSPEDSKRELLALKKWMLNRGII